MRLSRALACALAALALLPAAAQAQADDTIYENLSIPTVDGDRIHVEVARPKGVAKAAGDGARRALQAGSAASRKRSTTSGSSSVRRQSGSSSRDATCSRQRS